MSLWCLIVCDNQNLHQYMCAMSENAFNASPPALLVNEQKKCISDDPPSHLQPPTLSSSPFMPCQIDCHIIVI